VRSTGNAILAPMRRQLDVGSVLTRVYYDLREIEAEDRAAQAAAAEHQAPPAPAI